MATTAQVQSLIKAHYDHDEVRFKTVALQIAASEARQGHPKSSRDISAIVEKGPRSSQVISLANKDDLFHIEDAQVGLSDLILSDELNAKIERILDEWQNRDKLSAYGLASRKKILLAGPPGTGKTMTASVIAHELGMPLYVVRLDKLITKYLGETSARLRQIFDVIGNYLGVYLFDEFDAIGADRNLDNEVGEMRRILNTFLQFIEENKSESIIIAATNNEALLDKALFRRFDDVLHYDLPDTSQVQRLIASRMGRFAPNYTASEETLTSLARLSQSEISRVCEDAIKQAILDGGNITDDVLISLGEDRFALYQEESHGNETMGRKAV